MDLLKVMLKEIRESKYPTIIYGAGGYAEFVNDFLSGNGIKTVGFAVDKKYLPSPTHTHTHRSALTRKIHRFMILTSI